MPSGALRSHQCRSLLGSLSRAVVRDVTGALLYFDYGSSLTITLHWLGMWLIVGCTVGHVLVHWQLGAAPQLLRIFRPMRLQAQPPAFDPMDLLELFDQMSQA